MDTQLRETLKNKKRVIVKIGSSSLLHGRDRKIKSLKLERLVRELCDIKNQGMDVCLVSSGAIAVGRQSMGLKERPEKIAVKQACAAVGQARLMMTYQKLFRVPPECGTGSYDKKKLWLITCREKMPRILLKNCLKWELYQL